MVEMLLLLLMWVEAWALRHRRCRCTAGQGRGCQTRLVTSPPLPWRRHKPPRAAHCPPLPTVTM